MFAFSVLLLVAHRAFGAPCSGMNTTDPNDRIINGEVAAEGEFPFMVSMRSLCGRHICGGTILTKNWAMSAAHCFTRPSIKYIRSGSIYLNEGGTHHPIDRVITHENYNQEFMYGNDISLIRVAKPFTFDNNTQQVTLPTKDFPVESGENLTAIGWGYTDQDIECPSTQLMKADEIIAMTNEECGRRVVFQMFPGYFCTKTGPKQQSVCRGDSGGPILKNGVELGIASFRTSSDVNSLLFFSRVSHYIDWIREKLGPDAADLKFIKC